MRYEVQPQWLDHPVFCSYICGGRRPHSCGKHATGLVLGPKGAVYGPYCEQHAVDRMKQATKSEKMRKKRAKERARYIHPHPAHAAYLRKLALEDAERELAKGD